MNIILKSFFISFVVMSAICLIALVNILPEWYGLIVMFVSVFAAIFLCVYILVK